MSTDSGKITSRMREGFEQQRKAGVNVDWFTWQIAWNDAFFDQRAAVPVAPAAAAQMLLGSPAEGHWGEPETPSDGHRLESDVDEEAHPDEHAAFGYVAALKIALGVMDQYKAEQPKWWKRMDGTPILNDLPVRMAVAFSEASAGASDAGA